MFKLRQNLRRILATGLSACILLGALPVSAQTGDAAEQQTGYEIYPAPHSVVYGDGDYIIRNDINVVFENGIDEATRDRLEEVSDLKGLAVTVSDSVVTGTTNILVGIEGSGEYADVYADEHYQIATENLFDKTDSYLLASDNNVITVVGKDTDASFYGLTTLYHIVKQLESYSRSLFRRRNRKSGAGNSEPVYQRVCTSRRQEFGIHYCQLARNHSRD